MVGGLSAQENYAHTMSSRLGSKVRVIGWINDLAHFRHLVSLSLSDNQLDQFPVSLCTLSSLQVTHSHSHTHTQFILCESHVCVCAGVGHISQ